MSLPFDTHEVFNQSPPFEDVNLFTSDAPLSEAVAREGGRGAIGDLTAFGEELGKAETLEQGRIANARKPILRSFDERGQRLDRVEFHPAYHAFMSRSAKAGMHCSTWEHLKGTGKKAKENSETHVARLARIYLMSQVEPGHVCPITMTHACVAALVLQPDLAETWLPKILVRDYDPAFAPMAQKRAVTLGMGMTEKQGGTDVRTNTSEAKPAGKGGPGGEYILTGHKWFMSAPMCDAFMMLAQAPGGLSCFLVPRFLPDGRINDLRFVRLKEKMGNYSNASSEVEFAGAHAWLVGEEGRGVANILRMVTLTREDCAASSPGLMRWGLVNALHHVRHRNVFQKKLIDHPLMAMVLADMALDVEGATALAMRLGRAFDRADADEEEAAFARLMTPVAKYWCCKQVPAIAYEAMECWGGNGYVEDGVMARLFRESPLNAIWEGSGNVMCLDVLRVFAKEPEAARAILAGLRKEGGGDKHIAGALDEVVAIVGDPARAEAEARYAVERLAQAAAAALLNHHAPSYVAGAFSASRLGGGFRHTYGTFGGAGKGVEAAKILQRALPE